MVGFCVSRALRVTWVQLLCSKTRTHALLDRDRRVRKQASGHDFARPKNHLGAGKKRVKGARGVDCTRTATDLGIKPPPRRPRACILYRVRGIQACPGALDPFPFSQATTPAHVPIVRLLRGLSTTQGPCTPRFRLSAPGSIVSPERPERPEGSYAGCAGIPLTRSVRREAPGYSYLTYEVRLGPGTRT